MACNNQQLSCQDSDTSPWYCLTVPDIDQVDCSLIHTICECPQLQANPDIAGIGVMAAFLVSALLAWITTAGYLLLQPRTKKPRSNPIDEWCTRQISVRFRRLLKNPEIWSECCYRVTSSLSDQQLVTGIAILTAGFNMLGKGTVSAYHFSIIRDLAFFSSNAHLFSLLVLGAALRSERKLRREDGKKRRVSIPLVAWWRFVCMFVFWGLMMGAVWRTAYRLWDDWGDCPARCIPQEYGGTPLAWAIASTYFLVSQYMCYTLQLGEMIIGRADGLRNYTERKNDEIQMFLQDHMVWSRAYQMLWSGLKCWRWTTFSEFIEVAEMLAWFSANCYWAVGNRQAAQLYFGNSFQGRKERAREDDWGFGQIVPVMLLMLPAMTLLGTYHELMEKKMKQEKEDRYSNVSKAKQVTRSIGIQTRRWSDR